MPFYDSGATYDSGAHYASATPPPGPGTPKHMKKVKLDLSGKTDLEIISQATSHSQAVANHATTFPTPTPTAANFDAAIDAATAAQAAIDTAIQEVEAKRVLAAAAMKTLTEAYAKRAKYVEDIAETVPTAIQEAAMLEASSNNTPVGALAQPQNMRCQRGANPGEIKLLCAPVDGVKTYVWECRKHVDGEVFTQIKLTTTAKFTVTGLIPGVEYAFRVRAIGTAGESPWSDEAVMRAP